MNIKRNIAFHKHSKESWTEKEAINILTYVGAEGQLEKKDYGIVKSIYRPFFDDGGPCFHTAMANWSNQSNLKNCTDLYYEDIFGNESILSYKGFIVGDIIQWHNNSNDTDVIIAFKQNKKGDIEYLRKKANYFQPATSLTSNWEIKIKEPLYKRPDNLITKDMVQKAIDTIESNLPKSKETTMNPVIKISVNDKDIELCKHEAAACLKPKTDLQAASKWKTDYFDESGSLAESTNHSPSKAAAQLKTSEYLGYTARSYKAHTEATTNVPVVSKKV